MKMLNNKKFDENVEKIKHTFNKGKKTIKNYLIKKGILKNQSKTSEVKLVGFRMREVAILIIIATGIGVYSGGFFTYYYRYFNNPDLQEKSKYMSKFEEAFDDVVNKYYGEINKDKLIDAAIEGMVSSLDDYSSYMSPEEAKKFNEIMYGQYTGIGIELRTDVKNEHTITKVFEDGPAMLAGLKEGDKIIKMDDINTSGKSASEVASYIRSSNSSTIKLVVMRDGKELTLESNKTIVNIPSVSKKTFTSNNKKVGYISISIFANNTSEQFRKALEELEKENIVGLIIDVRTNSGGYLRATKDIIQMFLPQGKVMYQIQSKTKTDKFFDDTSEKRTYPVVVLTNKISASASEILAAAFKESYGSTIVGTTTYGKGTVQQPQTLQSGAVIKLTIEKWLTPKGKSIEGVGVEPTIEVLLPIEYGRSPTDENDAPLQKGLEIITE